MMKISAEQYHLDNVGASQPTLSCSIAKILLSKTPKHAWMAHPKLNPNYKPSDSESKTDIGTAAHSMLLEGRDVIEVIDAKDFRTKAAQEARDEARESGKIPLLEDQYDKVKNMVHVASNFSKGIVGSLSHDHAEQTFVWEESGITCKSRLDYLHFGTLIIDYKTTNLSNPGAWMRAIPENGYDIQESFYRRAVKSVTGNDTEFFFLVQETEEPYLCYWVSLPPAYHEIGDIKVQRAIDIWSKCIKENKWEGYTDKVMFPDPPAWLITDAENMKFNVK